MKVGLDLRCLPSDGSLGAGVAHAARALCSQLIKDRSIDWEIFVVKGASFPSVILSEMSSTNEVERSGPFSKPDPSRKATWSPRDFTSIPSDSTQDDKRRVIELADSSSKSLRRAIKASPCDVLFVPSGAVSLGIDIPAIPWVHDLIIFDHPEWFPESWLHRQLTMRLFLRGIKRAPIVFAVSEYTKQAIVHYARISPEKVIVTYEGGEEALRLMKNEELRMKNASQEYCQKKFRIERPFVLVLGTVEPRKNLAMLIRAWKTASLIKEGREVFGFDLVVAGRNGWKFEDVTREIKSLTSSETSRFHRIQEINDDDKRQLLLAASTVAIPSLDEGFGLVALEAMQANTQVIASNRGALPEVVGESGLLLDPEDEEAWAEVLNRSSNLEARISSLEQAQKFSWEKTAGVVLEGLKRLDRN